MARNDKACPAASGAHEEALLLELFRAATERQKRMVLGTLQSLVNRDRQTKDSDIFVIVGYGEGWRPGEQT